MSRYKRKVKNKRSGLYMVMIVVILMLSAVSIKQISLSGDCQKLTTEKQELDKKKSNLLRESKEIKENAAYIQTPKYIEDVAREKLGLVYKNEVIFEAEN